MINLRSYLASGLILFLGIASCGGQGVQFAEAPDAPQEESDSSADAQPYFLKEWQIGEPKEQSIIIDTGFGLVSQELSFQQAPPTQQQSTQMNRPIQTVVTNQGHNGNSATDNFAVSEAGLLDLLIVMDDSNSMVGYQQKLANNLPSILTHIGNTNWRIAVTTTSNSCLRTAQSGTIQILTKALYDNNPVNGEAIFAELLEVGTTGSWERGILMGTDALQGKCGANTTPWLRPSANIAMLIVTDEENCGSAQNEGCVGETWEKADYFIDTFGTEPTVHGLILLDDPPSNGNPGYDPTCDNSGYYDDPPNPTNYQELINLTGGVYADVCTSDYTTVLTQISQNVSDKINVQFELNSVPSNPNGLTIEIDGNPVTNYDVDGKTLTILDPVAPTANNLSVQYLHHPKPKTNNFSTNQAIDPSTLTVWLNDILVDPALYSYNENSQQVHFQNQPPDRAKIELNFRPNTLLPKEFSIDHSYLEGSFKALVNGKAVNFTINHDTKQIVFAEPPQDNAVVTISYAKPGDKKQQYPVVDSIKIDQLEEIRVLDRDTLEEIPVEFSEDGLLSFPESEIWSDRPIKVEYNREIDPQNLNFTLPIESQLLSDSLTIVADGDEEVCTQSLKITDKNLSFNCSDEDFETLEIRYKELVDYENSFTLDFDYSGPVTWRVFVDGREFEDFYQFEKTIVILKKDLPPGSKVRIEAHPASLEE